MHPCYRIGVAVAVLVLSASLAGAEVVVPGGFVNDTLYTGFTEPTSMAFLPDGRLLVTEQRTGQVRLFVQGHIAAQDPVYTVPDLIADEYERGLQGIAVDPGWPFRPWIYLYYNRVGGHCRLVRYRASGDLAEPSGEGLSLGDSLVLLDDIPDASGQHNAGCLRFGPGNYLYVGVGDDEAQCSASDSTSLSGAILRLDVSRLPDGPGDQVPRELITPPMNALVASEPNARLVWAYGLRNPWRFAIDPVTGAIYAADVGRDLYDEVNEVLPGDYLGWPFREGPVVHNVPGCPEWGGVGANAFKSPLVAIFHDGGPKAVNMAGMYRPVPDAKNNWPQNYCGYYGDVFYGDYFGGYLRRLKRLSGLWGVPPPAYGQPDPVNWATGLVTAVDFVVGPDGSLWWLSQFDETFGGSGSLQRIRWVGLTVGVGGTWAPEGGSIGIWPNPFRSEAHVAFHLRAKELVTLGLYDVAGRRVRELFRGVAPAGDNDLRWDGRDDLGRPAEPGVYFARLARDGGAPQTASVLRLR